MPRWIKGKLSAPTRESPWNPFTVYHQRTLTQTQRPRPMAEYWYDEAYHGLGLAIPEGFFAVHIGVPHSCHFCSNNFWQYPISHFFLNLTCFLVLSCSANVPGISLCPHSCKLYLYPYDCVIVGCIPGFVWFCLFFDTQFSRCFYLKSDGFIPSVVGFITVYPHYEWICPNFIQW